MGVKGLFKLSRNAECSTQASAWAFSAPFVSLHLRISCHRLTGEACVIWWQAFHFQRSVGSVVVSSCRGDEMGEETPRSCFQKHGSNTGTVLKSLFCIQRFVLQLGCTDSGSLTDSVVFLPVMRIASCGD